jgi:hypothetical protein
MTTLHGNCKPDVMIDEYTQCKIGARGQRSDTQLVCEVIVGEYRGCVVCCPAPFELSPVSFSRITAPRRICHQCLVGNLVI